MLQMLPSQDQHRKSFLFTDVPFRICTASEQRLLLALHLVEILITYILTLIRMFLRDVLLISINY